jgi:hypothetical protein
MGKEMKDRRFKSASTSLGVVLCNLKQAPPAASEFIEKEFQIKNRNQVYNHSNVLNVQWPNHSLNLTEPAVDEFNARGAANTVIASINFRAPNNDVIAARCRRLARYR